MPDDADDLSRSLIDLLAEEGIDRDRFREMASFFSPADLAEFLEDLDARDRVRVVELLEPDSAARVLEALPHELRIELVDRIGEAGLVAVVERMSPATVADIIDHLPAHREKAILDKLASPEQRAQIRTLRRHAPNTAGGLMTTNYIAVPQTLTAREGLQALQGAAAAEVLEYIYIVDAERRVAGVCSLRALLRAAPDAPLERLMRPDVSFVGASMDQEDVARLVQKYHLKAVPVVDNDLRLVGVITQSRIREVIQHAVGEDILRLAGASQLHPIHASLGARLRARVPWLSVTLVLEFIVSLVMKRYDRTLQRLALASFIPSIMAMGGNVGLQSSVMIVRGLATGELTRAQWIRVLFSEVRVGAVIGLLAGVIAGGAAFLINMGTGQAAILAAAVSGSMTLSITTAALMGTVTPLTVHRLGYDPALAAGPFITSCNDLLNVTIYLTVATLIVSHFVR